MKQSIKKEFKRVYLKVKGIPLPLSLAGKDYQLSHNNIKVLESEPEDSKVYCNINFDDQSPVFGQIEGRDYGGNIHTGLAKKLEGFLQRNPEVAITSFVIPNFLGNKKQFKDNFLLSRAEHKEWIGFYQNLSNQYQLEFALHGCYHHQKEVPFFMPHTELAFKRTEKTEALLTEGQSIFQDVGWRAYGFRQPGWDLNTSIDLPAIARNAGLLYIASNSFEAGFNANRVDRVSNFYPTMINGIINYPLNIELDWPLEKMIDRLDTYVAMRAFVSIQGHFVDKDICDCLSKKNFDKLEQLCQYIRKKYKHTIAFILLRDHARLLMKNKD